MRALAKLDKMTPASAEEAAKAAAKAKWWVLMRWLWRGSVRRQAEPLAFVLSMSIRKRVATWQRRRSKNMVVIWVT